MTLIVLILSILTLFAATDLFTAGHKRLHNQIYEIAFFITFFLFTIKYYYGADILFYHALALETPTIPELFRGEHLPHQYETGFELFISIAKTLHISLWGMSAIISVIYFAVIHKLFKQIETHRTLALCLLVALDFNLIFAAFRQCLAVSFFILMYYAYLDKKYFRMLLCCIITASLHKSGIFFGFGGFILLMLKEIKIKPTSYICLLVIMLFITILPINWILSHIPSTAEENAILHSIQYHLSFAQSWQPILPIYILCFIGMYSMQNNNRILSKTNILIFTGLILLAFLYQFFPMVWRLRSYFIPFLIVYLFSSVQASPNDTQVTNSNFLQRNKTLTAQLSYMVVFLFCCYTIVSCYRNQNLHKSGIYETCTIFDLRNEKYKGELQEKQLKKAKTYWTTESLTRSNKAQ